MSGTSTFTGNVTVSGGTLNVGGTVAAATATALGNLNTAGRSITVNSGAVLQFSGANATSQQQILTPLNISGEVISTVGDDGITFGPITLTGGTLTGTGGWVNSGNNFQMFNFGNGVTTGSITANGANPSFISLTGAGNGFDGFNLAGTTTISVSGGGALFISIPLLNEASAGATASLIKAGSGVLTLTAANVYSGSTSITAGTLQLGNGAANGSLASASIADSGALTFDNATAETYGGVISGTGALNALGPALLVLTNTNTLSGRYDDFGQHLAARQWRNQRLAGGQHQR